MELPFSPACDRNKDPILEVLSQYNLEGDLLEIGHGTGQHAQFFSQKLAVRWHPSDVEENLWMLHQRREFLDSRQREKLEEPRALKVGPAATLHRQLDRLFDHVFSANTLHIMSESEVLLFCEQVAEILHPEGHLFLYGPFKFNGQFTSSSNESFDQDLRSREGDMGIRDFETIRSKLVHFSFLKRYDLPANNQLLVFRRN